ncbi:hypothetical protein [Sorangium sp. So ce1151]|uniref:hypothetical protein n=1 Tax=Sorangium sp. So ce1151 TaxID=3133332 RepID=UPI003F637820
MIARAHCSDSLLPWLDRLWNRGNLDSYREVNLALAHLSSTVHLDAPPMGFSFFRSELSAIEESALDDEVWSFSDDNTATAKPDPRWKARMKVR